MSGMLKTLLALTVGVGAVAPVEGAAQPSDPRVGAAAVARALRSGEPSLANPWDALRQTAGPGLAAWKDSIADSVVAFILDYRQGGPIPHTQAFYALHHFIETGTGGVPFPYAGSADRLARIALEGEYSGFRSVAIFGLARSADRRLGMQHLVRLAKREDIVAEFAMDALAIEAGPEGIVALEQLYRSGDAENSRVVRRLADMAVRLAWRPRR